MRKLALFFSMFVFAWQVQAQVGINSDNSAPDPSAMLDVKSSGKGFLPPRMTHAEIDAISDPANGLIVYCTDCGEDGKGAFFGYINGNWSVLSPCPMPAQPAAGTHLTWSDKVVWKWNSVPGATGYKWNTTSDYSTAVDMAGALTKTENNLNCNTAYSRFVWSYNSCGTSFPGTLSAVTTFANPPQPATHVAGYHRIIWNWDPVAGAIGYKWNTTGDYLTAVDMGTATSKIDTGLAMNTRYDRYVWAYSSCGASTPQMITDRTQVPCGQNMTISHVSGEVAPVSKNTTYGTVGLIPGTLSKCWITSNLGSDHQATAVNDTTEASAGWYWQFNRKQGYKREGNTLTPAWPLAYNYENTDWQAANDPCSIELGTCWRIPLAYEWYDVDQGGY